MTPKQNQLRLFLAFASAILLPEQNRAEEMAKNVFHFGVSYASFGTVNRNDASAALKAWAASVSRERKLRTQVHVELFDVETDLIQALARGEMNAATVTAEGFASVVPQPGSVILPSKGGVFTEQYVLLAHRSSGIADIAQLKGRKLVCHESPKTSLASPWLETLLAGRGLGNTKEFLGEMTTVETASKAVLRVFFHQSDVCLVTSNAFAVACELNPQVRRDLLVLAVSSPVVPAMMFFRADQNSAIRQEVQDAILNLHSTPSGAQVLTVFQGDQMLKVSISALATTRNMLADFAKLHPLSDREQPPAAVANAGKKTP